MKEKILTSQKNYKKELQTITEYFSKTDCTLIFQNKTMCKCNSVVDSIGFEQSSGVWVTFWFIFSLSINLIGVQYKKAMKKYIHFMKTCHGPCNACTIVNGFDR